MRRPGAPSLRIVRSGGPVGGAELERCARYIPGVSVMRPDAGGPGLLASRQDGEPLALRLRDGALESDADDAGAVAVALKIARLLNGRVRNAQNETYRTPGETYLHPDDRLRRRRHARRHAWGVALLLGPLLAILTLVIAVRQQWLWPAPLTDPRSAVGEVLADLRRELNPAAADVLVVPADDFNERFAAHLAGRLAEATGLSVKATTAVGTAGLRQLPGSGQYDVNEMERLVRPVVEGLRRQYSSGFAILLTNKDLKDPDSSLRFLFAQHSTADAVSVVSAARLTAGDLLPYAGPDVIERRLLKFMLRSVGQHVYRLQRTTDLQSVMYSPIMSLSDVDRMGMRLDAFGKGR